MWVFFLQIDDKRQVFFRLYLSTIVRQENYQFLGVIQTNLITSEDEVLLYYNTKYSNSFQRGSDVWETTYQGLEADRRYFVEASWAADKGLHLYVNGDQVDRRAATDSVTREPGTSTETRAFIGRSSDGVELTDAVIDGVDIYYGSRDMLSSIGYIQKGLLFIH